MEMMEILLPLLGFVIGTVASMVGIGGGVFIVPLLTLLYGFSPPEAVGTSLATIVFTSLASTGNYARQKRIYYKTGLILAITTVPGAFLGAYLTSIIEAQLLGLIFGVFLFIVALRMIFEISFSRRKHSDMERNACSESSLLELKSKILLGSILSFFGGLSSGLLGIGGGSLLVPIMTLAMNIPMHITVATSMFTMVFTSISGGTQHYLQNHIRVGFVLLLALGTIFGAQLGAYMSNRISSRTLRRTFGIVLILVSIRMILKYGSHLF